MVESNFESTVERGLRKGGSVAGILVKSLDQDTQEHLEWFQELIFPDLPSAVPDIQRRIALGCEHILIEVVRTEEEAKGGEK